MELPEPRDEWERSLRALAVDCGVSLTDEQLSREEIYDEERTMHQALEATIDEQGRVTLLEELVLPSPRKAVVVVLDDAPAIASPAKPLTLADLGEPRNEWERKLRAMAVPAATYLTDEQLSRENIYD